MALSKRKIRTIVALLVLSLGGLVVFQVYLLNNALKLREQSFDNNVASVLTDITEMLETRHTMAVIVEAAGGSEYCDSAGIFPLGIDSSGDSIRPRIVAFKGDSQTVPIGGPCSPAELKNILALVRKDSIYLTDSLLPESLKDSKKGEINIRKSLDDSGFQVIKITASVNERAEFIDKVLNRMWLSEAVPIRERLDSALIDSIVRLNLSEANIDMDFAFGVKSEKDDSLILADADYSTELLGSKYKAQLFPYDFLSPAAELVLYFPEKQTFIWRQIIPMLVTIGVFITIIIICVIYIIRTIVLQKQTAALMTSFVNNMTHEFKTPISTISLAAEAILREDILSDGPKVSRYSRMILDENKRMRRQAEKILQMAALEEGDFELKKDNVDLHEIIREAAESIALQAEKQGGYVRCSLKADECMMKADKVHISGVIYNLLDNACKYSPDKPEIEVSTLNADGGIYIRISDKGTGIHSDDLKRVFEKYYRVASGNVHDVKGFGLGLSYVRMMVEAHGGTIKINSHPGEGTRVEMFLPQQR